MENYNVNYKEIILSKAKEIAMNEGIIKINIRTVAKNSGIAIGTVYNYFPSKGDLLVAVIEDFWEGVFKDIDWRGLADNNFYDNLEKVYSVLHDYLHNFKENWLEQLALLKTQEKLIGRQKEDEYFQKMYSKIILLIDMDSNLQQYQWSQTISKENMAEFIFENMLIMLKKEKGDMKFFIELLKKIMSN
ncbi:TetR family transcriptional regulator [Senegalia massiliensis]|uniref:TetR/AcrR family transcriptional regulator n=1 Tax=Senegalia massiliensis TaxID=1720316 RepID=A0A845QXZ6_9CLOT|nr:TetR/AcrR family transcriptional regulator [Senegalia massiliensis]